MPYTVKDAKADLAAAYFVHLCMIGVPDVESAEMYMHEYYCYSEARDDLCMDLIGLFYDPATVVRSYCDGTVEEPSITPIWNRANAASKRPYDFSF